jgi:galactokinase
MSPVQLFMPGRLCIVGEHSDWAGEYRREDSTVEAGLCMITGTDQGIYATAEASIGAFELRQIDSTGHPGPFLSYSTEPEALRDIARAALFDSYATGVASLILDRFPGLGLRLDVSRRTLPLRKGLSSSAAICVLTARAFNRVHGLGLTVEEEMEIAYLGEIMTGSECGRMDQACVFGNVPVILTFDGDHISVRVLKPACDLHLLIVDLRRSKNTRKILHDLNEAFLTGHPGVRNALGPANHRIMKTAGSAVERGDAETLGSLMTEAQEIFDRQIAPACPTELESPVLHSVLSNPAVAEFSWGGKGVGSQGDGSAQLLCRGAEARTHLTSLLTREMNVSCLDLTIPGAG